MNNSNNPYEAPERIEYPNIPEVNGMMSSKYGPFKSAKTLSYIVTVFLILDAIVTAILTLVSYNYLSAYNSGNDELSEKMDELSEFVDPTLIPLFIVLVILFCMWTHRSMKNTWALSSYTKNLITPGWAVGWYFIPIAMLWKPLGAVQQMRDIAFKSSNFSLASWWGCWLASDILYRIAQTLPTETDAQYTISTNFHIVAGVVNIAACVFAILMVRKITKSHDEVAE